MELLIGDFDDLMSRIEKEKPEIKAKLVKLYGDKRAEKAIKNSWDNARLVYGKILRRRRERLKNLIVNYDEENGCVSLEEFNDFFTSVEDELILAMRHCKEQETKKLAEDIHDFMRQKVGEIRIDRRLLFAKRYAENNP